MIEHDEKQRGVHVLTEDVLVQSERREDQADLAARDHADADEQAGRRASRSSPTTEASLPRTATINSNAAVPNTAGLAN